MVYPQKRLALLSSLVLAAVMTRTDGVAGDLEAGLAYHEFKLTLAPGERREGLGPMYYFEERESVHVWAVPPVFSYTLDRETDFSEFDLAYPFLTYDRFGSEYRFQILQLLNFAGGKTQTDANVRRFTLFPLYFQQRSPVAGKNYTALFPIYGRLQNRLFRDEIRFAMFPIYGQSRKKGIITDNYLYPIFHLRRGDGLRGWQLWPVVGSEHKDVTASTNEWGEAQKLGGHDKFFLLWPIFFNQTTGVGTENPERQQALLPLYSFLRSPQRDSTTCPWPLGLTITDDRARKYREVGAPWPLVVFARGEGKYGNRIWPLFGHVRNPILQSDFYLWPLYKYNRAHAAPLDRERTRILFFLYSDLSEKNEETGTALERTDLWPLFTAKRDHDGNQRLQVLALLEPFLPNNKSIERNYSPIWSIWRSESNGKSGASSQSFLWNLYRLDTTAKTRKCSLLFGLFQYQSDPEGKRLRILYIPFGKGKKPKPVQRES
jgi:hypothetical protein